MLENYGGVIFFFVVLLAAGGLISFVGDRIGTKIGKKRLSFWGLRPRHTATLSTVIAGCLIASVTFATLIGFDGSVRRALLEGRQIIGANGALLRQNAILRNQNAVLTTTQQTAAQTADIAQQQAKDAQAQAQTAINQAKAAQLHLQAARQLLQAEQRKARLAAAQITQAQAQIARAQTQANDLQSEHRTLLHANQLLASVNSKLTHNNDNLAQHAADLRLSSQFIYHNGDELGRRVIDTHQSAMMIYDELTRFMHELGQQALQHHGGVGKNGSTVMVFTPVKVNGKTESVPENESLKVLAHDITVRASSIRSVVVIAEAAFNTLPGEQTLIQLHPYPNPLVFAKGTVIAGGELNDDALRLGPFEALKEFLQDQVQPAARTHGIIPRLDPTTGQLSYGMPLDEATSADLAQQVRQAGAHAHVTATAAQDTYAAGPLVISLSVTP